MMTDAPFEDLSFEEALNQLEAIVKQLEENDVPLEKALNQYQKGIELSKICQQKLEEAEKTVAKVVNESGQEEVLEIDAVKPEE